MGRGEGAIFINGFASGFLVGLSGGLTSGCLGVSPGGGLVVFSLLLLGLGQHAAQGLSLVAQVPPTSLSGVRRYWKSGHRSPLLWLVLLGLGFLAGGAAGAKAAVLASRVLLQWTYVAYLSALGALAVLRPLDRPGASGGGASPRSLPPAALAATGAFAGFSSGFLGIGGGLALTVGLTAWLKLPQRQAQMISLMLLSVPLTLPAALVYWREGAVAPWPVLAGAILGLAVGADLGARAAHRIGDKALRALLIAFILSLVAVMTSEALR